MAGRALDAGAPVVMSAEAFGAIGGVALMRDQVTVDEPLVGILTSIGTQVALAMSHATERERFIEQERLAALGRLAAGVAHELRNH